MTKPGEEIRTKVYVEVVALHKKDGSCEPMLVIYADGRCFKIDRILDVRRAAAYHTGAVGLRYHVQIESKRTFLYYERPRWFVEAKSSCLAFEPGQPLR